MALKDRITINAAGLSSVQLEKLKKACFHRVEHYLSPGSTWEDVTIDSVEEKFADVLKAWVQDIDREEATISYTDMDA